MSVFDKLREVGAEVSERYKDFFTLDDDAPDLEELTREAADKENEADPPKVTDVASACAILEVDKDATLDEVRAAYDRLARHYYPQVGDDEAGQASMKVMDALLEALERLEADRLPVP